MLTGLMSSAHSRLPLMKPEPCSLVRIRPTRKPTVKMRTSSTPPATEVPPVPETPKSHAPLVSAAEGRLCAAAFPGAVSMHPHNNSRTIAVTFIGSSDGKGLGVGEGKVTGEARNRRQKNRERTQAADSSPGERAR